MAFTKEIAVNAMDAVMKAWNPCNYRSSSMDVITTTGLEGVYDNWLKNKGALRDKLSTHANWNEDAQAIIFSTKVTREVDHEKFKLLLKGEDGIYRRIRLIDIEAFKNEYQNLLTYMWDVLGHHEFLTVEEVSCLHSEFSWYAGNASNRRVKAALEEMDSFVKVGQKQSRMFNHFFEVTGLDSACGTYVNSQGKTVRWYDRWFAQFSDALSPREVSLVTALSVHPCDYLNMSKGTGWQSCHNMKSGSWRGGCLSYLNDSCSMVLFTATLDDNMDYSKLHTLPKINRQMYMWNENSLLASRLYPNYEADFRTTFIEKVKDIISTISGFDGEWVSHGVGTAKYNKLVKTGTFAVQYKDYDYSQYRTVLFTKPGDDSVLTIGNTPVSMKAGIEMPRYSASDIWGEFEICPDCGKLFSTATGNFVTLPDGTRICNDCGYVCAMCGSTHRKRDTTNTERYRGKFVCDDCVNSHQQTCAFCGALGFSGSMVRRRDKNGRYTAHYAHKDCVTDNFSICSCGTYQENAYAMRISYKDRDENVCSACATVVVDWLNQRI